MVESVGAYDRAGRFRHHSEAPAQLPGGSRSGHSGASSQSLSPDGFELSPPGHVCAHAPEVPVSPVGCLQALEDALSMLESTSKMPGCYVSSASFLAKEQHQRARDKLNALVHYSEHSHLTRLGSFRKGSHELCREESVLHAMNPK